MVLPFPLEQLNDRLETRDHRVHGQSSVTTGFKNYVRTVCMVVLVKQPLSMPIILRLVVIEVCRGMTCQLRVAVA
jgi:hypothetical protein